MTPVTRKGSAHWVGAIKDGKGLISTESGVLKQTPYGFTARFEDGKGTNPEELLGAAHAGCFTMALSGQLTTAGFKPAALDTSAAVTLEKDGDGFKITTVHLEVTARIPEANNEQFQKAALEAKTHCPVSKLFAGAKITMNATLHT
jgi:osmotically inducible protein OsmC